MGEIWVSAGATVFQVGAAPADAGRLGVFPGVSDASWLAHNFTSLSTESVTRRDCLRESRAKQDGGSLWFTGGGPAWPECLCCQAAGWYRTRRQSVLRSPGIPACVGEQRGAGSRWLTGSFVCKGGLPSSLSEWFPLGAVSFPNDESVPAHCSRKQHRTGRRRTCQRMAG